MPVEWIVAAEGLTQIAAKIGGALNFFKGLRPEERKKVADLLDKIAIDVIFVSTSTQERTDAAQLMCSNSYV